MSDRLKKAAKALIEAIQRDDTGQMVAGIWVGGNGGLLSRETIQKADELRRVLDELEARSE